MEIKSKVRVHNRFDIEIRDAKTGKLKRQLQAENIVLDNLFTRMINSFAGYFLYIQLGTGTGTLSATRTTLFTYLTGKAVGTPTYASDLAAGWISARCSIQLSELENNGAVITEVGIGYAASGSLCTHAMLKDMNGNTVSLTKTDTDIITIYATVYVVLPAAGWDGGRIAQNPAAYYGGAMTDNIFMLWLLGITNSRENGFVITVYDKMPPICISASRGYGSTSALLAATLTKDTANKRISAYARVPVASGNSGRGLRTISLAFGYNSEASSVIGFIYDLIDSAAFAGSTITGEALGTGNGSNQHFTTEFPLVEAGYTVKVDGVAATGVTVDTGAPNNDDLTPYMREISSYASEPYVGQASSSWALPAVGTAGPTWENMLYQTYGLYQMNVGKNWALQCSDDLSSWTTTNAAQNTTENLVTTIPSQYKNKRYWRLLAANAGYGKYYYCYNFKTADHANGNVHFDVAPANGAVITIDYTTPVIAKNATRVIDITWTLQFAEYTP